MKYVTSEEFKTLESVLVSSTLRELQQLTFILNQKPELIVNRVRKIYVDNGYPYYESFCAAFEIVQFLHKYTKPFKETINA